MSLPRPFAPMEAQLVSEIPVGNHWQYEPKWDGFRCVAFRDTQKLEMFSKAGQDLTRYFPELVEAFLNLKANQFAIDGEIAISIDGRFSFNELLQRIHPAKSRVQELSQQTPAIFIAFDLLCGPEGKDLIEQPLRERRQALEEFATKYLAGQRSIRLSPASSDLTQAKQWFKTVGNDLDGIIAKRLDFPYQSGERGGIQKVKLVRTADCVAGGFRYAENKKLIGSILLGLYDDAGLLHHVGFCSGLKAAARQSLVPKLERLIEPPGFTGHAPGGLSRWSTRRSMEWQPLKPQLVVEVSYDHFTGGRFRHGTRLVRWRPDKRPEQCQMEQVAATGKGSLALLS